MGTPKLIACVTGALLLVASAAPAAADAAGTKRACHNADGRPGVITVKQARYAVLCLINRKRRHFGAGRLRLHRKLTRAAQRHSLAMDRLNFFSHYSPSGKSPASRIGATGYLSGARAWGVAENIGYGTGRLGSPRRTVRGWLNSRPHRRAMLSRRYRHIGIGVAFGSPRGAARNAGIYTTDFGFRR